MFIGHFGVGFAGKRIGRRVSLGTLFMAAQFLDLLWPLFLLIGLEHVQIDPGNTALTPLNFTYYPYTHSLLGALIWSLLFALVYFLFRKNGKNAFLLGGLVLSHWVLDLIVHRPDLPLLPWLELKVGFGLWNHAAAAVIVESLIFLAGVVIYFKATRAQNKTGSFALWGLVIFLALVYAMNLMGPPPDSVTAIGIVGLFQWLLVAWAYWVDRNREVIVSQPTVPRESG